MEVVEVAAPAAADDESVIVLDDRSKALSIGLEHGVMQTLGDLSVAGRHERLRPGTSRIFQVKIVRHGHLQS